MIKDFYLRLVVVFIMVLGVSVVISSFALVPSYFFSLTKKKFSEEKLLQQKSVPTPQFDQNALLLIGELNSKLSLIENTKKNKFLVSERVINEILSKRTSDIKINKISYQINPLNEHAISIHGTAPSREKLLFFRQTLEADARFSKIHLPISNFIKGTDIKFTVDLIAL